MKTMGFLISHKNNEKRRAILPEDLQKVKNCSLLYFEKGYGDVLGISDREYEKYNVHLVPRNVVLQCDIITDVKLGDADYLEALKEGKVLFGWAHAVQGIEFCNKAIRGRHTVIAWEELYESGRYVFYRNREIAGEAAILHAFRYCGKMPYDAKVAIIGNGQTAKGALRVLHGLGAKVDVYGRKFERLFREKMFDYDVLVNCVMWDTNRSDRIIYADDVKKMKKDTLIIDVSCDPHLEIETSHATTIDEPIYEVDGVIHYAVDNTPAMYPKTVTKILSEKVSEFVDNIIESNYSDILENAVVIKNGTIIDKNIEMFRKARGLFC